MSENKGIVDTIKQTLNDGADFAKSKAPIVTEGVKSAGKLIVDKGTDVAETAVDIVGTGAFKAVDLGISAKRNIGKADELKDKALSVANSGKEKALSAGRVVVEKGSDVLDAAGDLPPVVAVRESKAGRTVTSGAKRAVDFAGDRVEDVKAIVFVETPSAKDIQTALLTCYAVMLKDIEKLVEPYQKKHHSPDKAAREWCRHYMVKSGTSPFVDEVKDLGLLPDSIPLNLARMWHLQLEMCAGVALIGGFDVTNDRVKTLVMLALTGQRLRDSLHRHGIDFGNNFSEVSIYLLNPSVKDNLNKAVYEGFEKKFKEAGIVNVGKAIPLVGSVISGGLDFADTTIISRNARHFFINRRG
ncbi:MAG: hypothetical protein J6P61_03225 [Erysipelotrichaceae bacterium]|nr:hypothetical protein [Erysipelotrichaceae bacterium]